MADAEYPRQTHRPDHHILINSLKTVVEGLLATHTTDVWSTYGGLNRVTKEVENILLHGLKSTQGNFGSQVDFWPFIHGLKRLNPIQSPSIDKIIRLAHYTPGIDKGHVWVKDSLREHNLTAQLKTLVNNKEHLYQFYYDFAFLCEEEYFLSMCICLQAVEQNRVTLLAELDLNLLNGRKKHEVKRSESLPVMRRSSAHHDTMALAPPFASPKQESVLCLSDEHAVPVCIGSDSPIETKMMAREALRSVLRKSGSDSPTEPQESGFSFYDNQTDDPLSHVTITEHQTLDSVENSTELPKSKTKFDSKVNTMPVKKAMTPEPVSSSSSQFSRQEEIFSDSEAMTEGKRNLKKSSSKSSVKGHKRSRSDMSWLNTVPKEQVSQRKQSEDISGAAEEDSGTDVNSPASPESYLCRPMQGQSLIHFLSSQDFHTCANLDKENAHFSISEALIAAIEQMKWNHVISPHQIKENDEEEDSDEEIQQLKQRIRIRKRERLKEKASGLSAFSDGVTDTATSNSTSPPFSSPVGSSSYTDSSDSSEVADEQIELTMTENITESNLMSLKKDGLSLSLASLYSDGDIQQRNNQMFVDRQSSIAIDNSVNNSLSAESVAISLLKKFSEKQLPKASDLVWLVSENDAPQKLLPMPDSYPISPDDADEVKFKLQTRLRGNMEWAPPRPQIIFNIHQRPNRKTMMEKQHYLCAGCGTRVEPGYISRLRYCEYLGKYFCQCCHSKAIFYIPGRILKKWDFNKYQVSNFSLDLLTKMYNEPLFNICDINNALYKRVKTLDSILELRLQLQNVRKFLMICKDAVKLLSDVKNLPAYWSDDVHIYSLSDLVNVKSQLMLNQLRNVVTASISHVENCQFCKGLGFICEFCNNDKDIIFPFQLHKVEICKGCKSCFHKDCFVPEKCPRCARLEARRQRLEHKFSDEFDEVEEVIEDG